MITIAFCGPRIVFQSEKYVSEIIIYFEWTPTLPQPDARGRDRTRVLKSLRRGDLDINNRSVQFCIDWKILSCRVRFGVMV